MHKFRDAGVMFRMVHEAMKRKGIDTEEVFRRLGVDESYLLDPDLRTPHGAQTYFWEIVENMTQDADIGLHLGQCLPPFRGEVLEYLFMSSPTFGDGLNRALRYQRLLMDVADSGLEERDGQCFMRLGSSEDEITWLRHFNECFVQGLTAFFESVTDGRFRLSKVEFQFKRDKGIAKVESIFGCPVRYEAECNQICFPVEMLSMPSPRHHPELLSLHEQVAREQIEKLSNQDVVDQVERMIGESLESGDLTLDTVAARMGMKSRSLRTRLYAAGTSFNQVFANYRYRLARRLLTSTRESIDEIVYLTGFADLSTFYRAFKRWSGTTPSEYRRINADNEEHGLQPGVGRRHRI